MNLESLRRLARWADKIATAQREMADDLAKELAQAEQSRDPLGLHIYQARARYRRTSDRDNSKTAKRTSLELNTTYAEALRLGFTGSRGVWEMVMRTGTVSEGSMASQETPAHLENSGPPCDDSTGA